MRVERGGVHKQAGRQMHEMRVRVSESEIDRWREGSDRLACGYGYGYGVQE
jgi:hypothetical protein